MITMAILFLLLTLIVIMLGILGYMYFKIKYLEKNIIVLNNEVINLIKYKNESKDILLKHIELLKFLIEQTPNNLFKSPWEA